jgi:hypothetical protein
MVRACTELDYPEFIKGKCSRTIDKTAIKLSLTTAPNSPLLRRGVGGEVLPKTSIPNRFSMNTKIPPLSV